MDRDPVAVAIGPLDPAADHHGLVVQLDIVHMPGPRVDHRPGKGLVPDHLGDRLVAEQRRPGCSHVPTVARTTDGARPLGRDPGSPGCIGSGRGV